MGGIIALPSVSLVTLVFLKVEGQNLLTWGTLNVLSSKMALIFRFRATMTSLWKAQIW